MWADTRADDAPCAWAWLALPVPPLPADPVFRRAGSPRRLFAVTAFRALLLVTALIQGSHALYASYATLRWKVA